MFAFLHLIYIFLIYISVFMIAKANMLFILELTIQKQKDSLLFEYAFLECFAFRYIII